VGWREHVRCRLGLTAVAAAALTSLIAGCGLVGRPASQQQQGNSEVITVSSPVFAQGVIPRQYTCRGVGQSPPIYWSGAPAGTRSLALVVDDSDAPITPYVYWIVFDISPTSTEIEPGQLPAGASEADNSLGKAGYDPMCPDASHKYRFTVYALDARLRLRSGASLMAAWSAIASHVIAYGRLTATARP
jgi:Raf kinase inhibitor-like YbhB/YbcL family protein